MQSLRCERGKLILKKKKRICFENTPHCIPYSWFFSSSMCGIIELRETFHWDTHWNVFDLVTLTIDLDLQTWPRYPSTWPTCRNSSPYICPFGHESGNRQTDTHTQTHRRCQNYYTQHVTDVGCKNIALEENANLVNSPSVHNDPHLIHHHIHQSYQFPHHKLAFPLHTESDHTSRTQVDTVYLWCFSVHLIHLGNQPTHQGKT